MFMPLATPGNQSPIAFSNQGMQKRLTVKLVKENAANRAAEFKRRREIIGTYDEVELILDS